MNRSIKFHFPGNDQEKPDDLPGYPHYPNSEDITRPENAKRVDLEPTDSESELPDEMEDEINIVPGTEADVTAEDLEMLGPKDEDMDMGEDETTPRIMAENEDGADLDVPGAELDDENEALGEEDEENNYYSLGGDKND